MSSDPAFDQAAFIAARKRRNIFILLALIAFCALLYAITLVRLKGDVLRERDWTPEPKPPITAPNLPPAKPTPPPG